MKEPEYDEVDFRNDNSEDADICWQCGNLLAYCKCEEDKEE